MMEVPFFSGKKATPAAQFATALISAVVFALLLFNAVPETWRIYLGIFLLYALGNQVYVTASDLGNDKCICPHCNVQVPTQTNVVPASHKCKKTRQHSNS